jgi:hypothetical protein
VPAGAKSEGFVLGRYADPGRSFAYASRLEMELEDGEIAENIFRTFSLAT